ncbi:UDP-N-acetylmuramate--L-alanine ligase [soil metagenome]
MIPPNFALDVPADLGPVHFIGIGGSGMTGIAHMMLDAGLTVSGSDRSDNKYLDKLRARGVKISIGHDAANLPDDARTIVYTSALWPDNPEYLLAKSRGLNLLHRSQALHWLSRDNRVVTIAGAHGKTTTTGMIVTILRELGVDPGFVNGGIVLSLGASSATGTDDLFVLEADESDGSFRIYDTDVALVTNVDTVHMDHYGSADGVIEAYAAFVADSTADFVIAGEGANVDAVLARVPGKRHMRFGEAEGVDMRVSDIVTTDHVTFDLTWHGVTHRGRVNVPGRHTAINAAGAVAAVVELGYPFDTAIAALEVFAGTNRRFELMNVVRGVSCYDDYAHEPAEAAAAVAGAQTVVGGGRVIAIHQPHLYSRTQMFSQDFAKAYEENADFTIVIAVDGAREDPIDGVSGQLVVDGFEDKSKVKLVEDWDEAAAFMATLAREGDIVMTLSCGTVYQLHPFLKGALEATDEPARDLIAEGVAGTPS